MTPGCREMIAEALRHIGEALDLVMACAKDERAAAGGEAWTTNQLDWAVTRLIEARVNLNNVSGAQ